MALLLLVLAGVGHIHGHICLDGREPPLTVHFENLPSLAHHTDDGDHADIDTELMPQGLLFKAPDQGAPLFLLMVALLPVFEATESRQYSTTHTFSVVHPPNELLPPAQAPPTLS